MISQQVHSHPPWFHAKDSSSSSLSDGWADLEREPPVQHPRPRFGRDFFVHEMSGEKWWKFQEISWAPKNFIYIYIQLFLCIHTNLPKKINHPWIGKRNISPMDPMVRSWAMDYWNPILWGSKSKLLQFWLFFSNRTWQSKGHIVDFNPAIQVVQVRYIEEWSSSHKMRSAGNKIELPLPLVAPVKGFSKHLWGKDLHRSCQHCRFESSIQKFGTFIAGTFRTRRLPNGTDWSLARPMQKT